MKVVWTNQFAQLPSYGGGTRHFEFAKELQNYGIQVTVIAGNRNYLSGKRVFEKDGCHVIDGVNFCTIDIAYRPGYIKRVYSWLEFAFKLKRFKDVFKEADIIIGSTPTLFGAYSTMQIAHKLNKPFILEVRDLWPEILYYSGKISKHSPVYILLEKIAKKLYKDSNHIITLSEGQKTYIKTLTTVTPTVVYNGVSDQIVKNIHVKEKFKGFNLVYAGALGYANDIDTIIESAKFLRDKNEIKFHILGDGVYRNKLLRDIERYNLNITYYGMLPKKQAFSIMAACQIGLLTLRDIELFKFGVSPNKLFDYLSLGLYVISTVQGEMGKIALDSECGITIPPSNPKKLSKTIYENYLKYLKNPDTLDCTKGTEYIFQRFSRKVMAKRIVEVLKNAKRKTINP